MLTSPMSLKTELMPHQVAAVNKVLPSRIGALFMEMGTGKSRTAIELAHQRWDKVDKIIWFCPVSLKETVRQELLKHTDCSDIYVFSDKTSDTNLPRATWYIVGIESMSASTRVVLAANKLITTRTMVILDESSYIKGHRAMRTQRITKLSEKARYRLILTGTPLSQGVVDLFAQMRFLSPKILGYDSFYSFAANHLEYSEKYPGRIVRSHNTKYLAAKIQPYVYQVTKAECLDLPRKLHETRYCTMTGEQWNYYESIKEEILATIIDDDFFSSQIAIFRLFTALQEVACGFHNRRVGADFKLIEFEHNRIDTLLEVIQDISEAEKVVIWAKFQYDVEQIGRRLRTEFGDEVAFFHGGLTEKQRNAELLKFRNDARFFLSTQSCGGHGLTLTEASHVIFYNNGFKYSERLQAEDRCHRISQSKPVTYIDIECCCGIDERISKALAKKGSLVQEFREQVDKIKDVKKLKELIKSL